MALHRRGSARAVRLIDGVRVVGLPGSVLMRVTATDDAGRPCESSLGELSITGALALAQRLLDEAVKAADFADAMPPDYLREGEAA